MSDRDVLRLHWIKTQDVNQINILRFARPVFGLNQWPFVLKAILEEHISKYGDVHKRTVEEIAVSMYVDDLISDSYKEEKVIQTKET